MSELNWRPARRPQRAPLDGESVRLEPLSPERHGEDLFAATKGADATWFYLPYGPFAGKREFVEWLEERVALDDPLAFTIIGDIVPHFILRRVVPLLFLDQFEAAAFARIGRVENVGKKFNAL